ncbi:MurR/RpiR family transcriptional regulator [Nocardia sp. NPDC051030]|uniref:MurR/RpiR family transcriptional regulator n=1 Tax=Nocardia sp. NPDC051030 TaxID=3155162 RepID=UPI00342C6432
MSSAEKESSRGPLASPRSTSALRASVRALLPSMTPAMQRIAETVAADPAGCAELTVTRLAERTGTSEATVSRTARTLGYRGYPELRRALAALAASQENMGPEALTVVEVDDPLSTVIAKLAREERQVLADTAALLDVAQLGGAVEALAAARRIDVYGIAASGLVAIDLAQKLLRIGLIAHAHTELHLAVTSAVQLRAGDVAIAISHSGSTIDVLEPLRRARENGATTVAVTSRPAGTIARTADHVLTTAAGQESALRPAAMGSRTSQLLVIDCLFIGVVQRTYDTARQGLIASHEALAARHPQQK